MKKQGFSLMEMMVVLLIVSIVAAASAPVVSKKLASDVLKFQSSSSSSSDDGCLWLQSATSAQIYYPSTSNNSVSIGSNTVPANANNPRLYIISENSTAIPQIKIGISDNNSVKITAADNDISISNNNDSHYVGATALGFGAKAAANGASALGYGAEASGGNSIAAGYNSKASGTNSIALGGSVSSTAENSVAISGNALETGSIAIGNAAESNSFHAIALGSQISSNDRSNAISIGNGSQVSGRDAIVIGIGETTSTYNCSSAGSGCVAIGRAVKASGSNSVAIGSQQTSANTESVALGANVTAGNCSVAIGSPITGNGYSGGTITTTADNYSVALGYRANAQGNNSIAIGPLASAANGGIAIGPNISRSGPGLNVGNKVVCNYDNGALTINGNLHLKSENGYIFQIPNSDNITSDRRLKNIGEKFTSGLEEIKKLKVYNYTFKDDKSKTPRVGIIAQDLKEVFPDAVFKGGDGFYSIRMEDILYAMVNSVIELDKKITAMLKREWDIARLKTRAASLEKRISALEQKIE